MQDLRPRLEQALAGRYRLEGELGHGGMGIVFLATDVKHGRKVALKVLRPELTQSLGADRFLREIRITAQLNHPNILTLIDSGSAGEFMYYVLPYVDGESLRDRLTRETQLPVDEALRITRETADALAYAHDAGVVHRDIKPENILFEAGHAVVADFGIAQAVSEAAGGRLTESGLIVGTPAYMSPEQAMGSGSIDARSDIYSLGCVLYEMLAGMPPYGGPTPHAILARKSMEPVPGLRIVRDTVPPAVESAIVRALAKTPADRFATAREFATALSQPTTAHRPVRPSALFVTASVIVVIAAAAYVALAISKGGEKSGARATFARLTGDDGIEWFPSLSPDGKWLVYAGEAAGNRDIYLQSVGGQNPINLTADSPDKDDQPVFSPDGEGIAFRSERDGGGIFVMGRTGEAARRITRGGYKPTWSPEGTQIAYATENVEFNPQNSESKSELWIADAQSGKTRHIVEAVDATMPSWSPHGQRIAYFQRLGEVAGGHIWTVPVTGGGGEPAQLTSGKARDWNPTWSPDGRSLYFVSDRGGSMNLWRVRVDEAAGRALAEPEPITTPATSLAHISLSADGRHIAYSSVLVTTNVQRASFDPVRGAVVGEPTWLTHGSRRWANPAPSPDGQQVVFYSLVEPEGDLYVMRADGVGSPRQLTSDSASDRVPRWSPDGNWISVFSNRSGPLHIWKIRPDGSGLKQLTDGPVNTSYGVWSPDGSRMTGATIIGTWTNFIFDPNRPWNEQHPELLPPPPDSLAPFGPHSWSADGRRIAGMIGAVDRGIVVYTLGSRTYQRLTDFGQWPVWLPDSRRLLFVSGGKAFYVVDRETKAVRKVFAVARDVIGPPQLTPDGRSMYFTRRVTEADIWLATLP